MSKKRDISDEDKALFRQSVAGIKPLSASKNKPKSQTSDPSVEYRRRKAVTEDVPLEPLTLSKITLTAEDKVLFAKPGLQQRQLKKLKKGQFPCQAQLDLHGYSLTEAEQILESFIIDSQEQNYRTVMVIHGKGYRSAEDKPLMKNFAVQYLQAHPQVIALSSAIQKEGGSGALYVLLKRSL